MMSDVNGQMGSSASTVHLSPEQLLCVLPKGVWVCQVTEGLRCERCLYLQHHYKLFREEPAQQQQQHTHPLCAQRMFLIPLRLSWFNSQLLCYVQLVL